MSDSDEGNDRQRTWIVTINNFTEEDENCVYAASLIALAGSFGKERGEECGTPHLQGIVTFKSLKSREQLQELFPRAWFKNKSARSTFKDAYDYTQKGEQSKEEWHEMKSSGPNFGKNADVFQWGKRPQDPKENGENERARLKRNLDLCMQNKRSEMDIDLQCYQMRNFDYAASKLKQEAANIEKMPGQPWEYHEWHYGVPGSGKTEYAHSHEGAYIHELTTDWNLYDFEDVVIIDDVDPSHARLLPKFKVWMDTKPIQANIKYGNLKIRPKKVIVTSNHHPSEIWTKKVDYQAMIRRFKLFTWRETYYIPGTHDVNPKWSKPEGLIMPEIDLINYNAVDIEAL